VPWTSPHLPSRVLGRYAMYEQFAAGGMATLHYGRLLGTAGFSRTVAIKRLHAHLSEDPDFVAMFLDEARLAARIHHPNVIQTLDVESSEGELFVVLDYVHGDSLSRLLREARRVGEPATPALVCAILFGALEGLHAAHEARDPLGEPLELVHRDVSPHNILIGTDGIARVLDFGVAKARGRAQTTRVGQLKGKLSYMAPEQLRGGKVTRRSDVFSAAVVLWEALAGTRLFQGDDEGEVVNRLLTEAIPSPRQFAPGLPRELEAIVMQGLERDPARRFPTARHMALALEALALMATPIEVGAWVERVAGVTLAQRAQRVAAIEAEFNRVIDSAPAERAGAIVVGALPPHRPAAPSVTGATAPTVAVPGLALAEDRTIVDPATDATRTGVASVSDMDARALTRRRPRVATLAWILGGGVALGLVLMIRLAGHETPQEAAMGAAFSTVASAPAASSPPPVASQAIENPAPEETTEANPLPQSEVPIRRAPPPAVRKHVACSPPYTVDARGVRHYKPECL
jgi:eukaryotic-like serine/threonine-protein kinase